MILNLDDDKNILFDGDDEIFKKHVIESKFYFEYGVGRSTKWVLENTRSNIIAVDSYSDSYLQDATLAWQVNGVQEEFVIQNEELETGRCGCGESFTV